MKIRFVGTYNGEPTITMGVYTFHGNAPTEVDETTDMGKRLKKNPDFEVVDALDHDGDGKKGGSMPDDPPSLTGKNKAQLLEIAQAEGVEANDGMTNKAITEAIEKARK